MEKKFRLDDHKKQDPFRAPEGYFDSLAARLAARIEGQRAEKTVRVFPLRTYLAIAASIIGMIAIAWFGYSTLQGSANSAEALLAQVSNDDLAAYISSDDLEIEDVVSFVEGDIMNESPESIEDALHSLDDETIDDLYNDFGISKDDTL